MAKKRQAAPVNQLVKEGMPQDTIDRCMDVIEFVRQSTIADDDETIDYGRFLILGLVHDALGHVNAEIHACDTRMAPEKRSAAVSASVNQPERLIERSSTS
jgi:hypothetical protein